MRKIYPDIHWNFFIIAAIGIIFILWINLSGQNHPTARDGVLDLTEWDMESQGRITLSGDWEFNWKEFLTYEDYQSGNHGESIHASVPRSWNRYRLNEDRLPGQGYATYHLKVKLRDTDPLLGLRISCMSTAYRLYINDTLMAGNGKISTSEEGSEPEYNPQTVVFEPPADEFDIIVQVSNYIYARGGLWYDIEFGTAEQIREYESYLKYRDGIVIGVLSIMAIYFFCCFIMFRGDRKGFSFRFCFSFMLMCLILIVRTSLYGDYLIIRLFPDISFRLLIWISYLTLFWFPVVLYQMIEFYLNQSEERTKAIPFYYYAAVMSVITALIPVSFYTEWTLAIDLAAIVIVVAGLCKVFFAHLRSVPGANVIFPGSIIVGLAGLHDILYQANLIHSHAGELTSIGLILFMMLLFFHMADRFAKTYREVQSLSKEMEENLKREKELTERLYALDKMKDEFLASTSHELRTPLDGIINITESVLQGIGGHINSIQRQNLEIVLNTAKKLHVIINDLLDVSLLRNGGFRITPTSLNMRTLIGNMLVVFHHIKKDERIELCNLIPPDFPPVYADEARLRQILSNLIGNAVKYTESGTIMISAMHNDEWAQLCIEDTGVGMTKETLENVFNAFEEVDGTIQRKYEGAGLGLYITRQLVELHGGKIWIHSDLGVGTRVFFTLPLCKDEEINSSSAPVASEDGFPVLDSLEFNISDAEIPFDILVADDDPPSLKALTNILHLAGYNARGVSSGKEALSLLENGNPFELVILDVMMPELSGYEVLETLRKKYNRLELPVLMLIAKSQNDDMSLCFKLGANDYLTRPFEVEELLARVNSLVRLKKAVNKLVNTEMSFLQAQIKPHFIHNALSVISSLSIKDPPKAKSLILDLSDYLRGCFDLNNEEGLTTLSRELELVRAYVSIEQARFKERLRIHYQLLEDVDCTLPLLTIQPLVENAIRHGIMCRAEGGEISITTSLVPDRVRIEIKDNGVGIDPVKLEKFIEGRQEQRGVGLSNIHRRLMTHYGEGLHIESVPNQGTTICFYVPYHSPHKEVQE